MKKKTIHIDTDALLYAMEDRSMERGYFLDWETGEIEVLCYDTFVEEEDELLQERIEAEEGRYKRIDPLEPEESFSIMEEFIPTVKNEKATESLLKALSGRKPFRHFKETLSSFPEIREQWFSFKQEKLKELAIKELAPKIEELEQSGMEIAFRPLPGVSC
jgi:hypothetical protein